MLRCYLTTLFAVRLLGALFGLTAVLQLLDLLDKAGSIITRGGISGVGRYIGLRLPTLLAEMLPLATLIGASLTFRRLAGTREITALRAAGVSLRQVLIALLPFCIAVSAVQFVLQTEIAPRAERAFADWWDGAAPPTDAGVAPPRLWLRTHGEVAAIASMSPDGQSLEGLMIVKRSPQGDLVARLDARSARYGSEGWILKDVRIIQSGRTQAEPLQQLAWPDGPAPANMIALARPVESLTLNQLVATLRGDWAGARAPAFYWTQLDGIIAALFDPIVMVLLAAPALLMPPRAEGGLTTATGLTLGLGYLMSGGLLAALGSAQTLPPWLAGSAATLLFAVIGGVRVLQSDES